ncbi:hypothetical protein AVEN_124686-1 [Araneus ventricosus]|uniref:RNase H type-1 domain-containing protein n=1 Tax=Araneus ventricosus TaxID=182803 RepID=A0A4Y2JLU2_ARAVE|nr:hypothetical protein AVEN_124686-1 [Araneus ventricosus]
MKATGWSIHLSQYLKSNQISFEDVEANIVRKDITNIFTNGSKTKHGVGAVFCVLINDNWAYQWSVKLNDSTYFCQEISNLNQNLQLVLISEKMRLKRRYLCKKKHLPIWQEPKYVALNFDG